MRYSVLGFLILASLASGGDISQGDEPLNLK